MLDGVGCSTVARTPLSSSAIRYCVLGVLVSDYVKYYSRYCFIMHMTRTWLYNRWTHSSLKLWPWVTLRRSSLAITVKVWVRAGSWTRSSSRKCMATMQIKCLRSPVTSGLTTTRAIKRQNESYSYLVWRHSNVAGRHFTICLLAYVQTFRIKFLLQKLENWMMNLKDRSRALRHVSWITLLYVSESWFAMI